jgi:hypothetical protein
VPGEEEAVVVDARGVVDVCSGCHEPMHERL